LCVILNKFIEIQDRYPLGVCVNPKIHTLFHSLYGQYNNTEEQWNVFVDNYKNNYYQEIKIA